MTETTITDLAIKVIENAHHDSDADIEKHTAIVASDHDVSQNRLAERVSDLTQHTSGLEPSDSSALPTTDEVEQ